jgi:hypothetical protein
MSCSGSVLLLCWLKNVVASPAIPLDVTGGTDAGVA